MAEILIQRRRHRNVWPWLLGLLALALLPLPFLAAGREDRPNTGRAIGRRDTSAGRDTTVQREARDTTVPGSNVQPGGVPTGAARRGGTPARTAGPTGAATQPAQRTTASVGGSVAPPAAAVAAPSPTGPATGTAASPRPTPASPTAGASSGASGGASGGASATSSRGASAPTTFEAFIAARPANPNEREHRAYTADALRRLADELRTLGASSVGVRAITANADSLRMTGTRLTAHPDYARAAFLAAVREMDVLRGRYRAPVDTGALRAAAWAIRPDQRFVAQRGIVQTFFERARDALHALSRSAGARRAATRRSR